jgi:Fe-Mn family superoxide dismutase
MAVVLPELPYPKNALAPHISEKTLEFHHSKHHNAYVVNTNKLVEGTDLAHDDLETIIMKTARDDSKAAIFNNAAQVWNHSFYWQCMKPNGGGPPAGAISEKINADFGSYEKFVEALKTSGSTQFGSGWAWLIMKDNKLQIANTANADNPIAQGLTPLLTIDVWEHAYYLDYQNRRPDYLKAFVEDLINWDYVNTLLA